MNGTSIYRVTEILAGDSPTATVLGVDAALRELRLDLPVEQARQLRRDAALVLSWSTHAMPDPAPPPSPTLGVTPRSVMIMDETLEALDAAADCELAFIFGAPLETSAPRSAAAPGRPTGDPMSLLLK